MIFKGIYKAKWSKESFRVPECFFVTFEKKGFNRSKDMNYTSTFCNREIHVVPRNQGVQP